MAEKNGRTWAAGSRDFGERAAAGRRNGKRGAHPQELYNLLVPPRPLGICVGRAETWRRA